MSKSSRKKKVLKRNTKRQYFQGGPYMDPHQIVNDAANPVIDPVTGQPMVNTTTNTGINTGINTMGNTRSFGANYNAGTAGTYGQVANLLGTGIQSLSDDRDATNMTRGEKAGGILAGAGKGAATGAMFGPLGLIAGAVIGGIGASVKGKKATDEAKTKHNISMMQNQGRPDAMQNFNVSGYDTGFNVGNTLSNSYQPGYQMAKNGGKMKAQMALPPGTNMTPEMQKAFAAMSPELQKNVTQSMSVTPKIEAPTPQNYYLKEGHMSKQDAAINKQKVIDKVSADRSARTSKALADLGQFVYENPLDATQIGLGALAIGADSIPIVGNAVSVGADLVNAGISGGRSLYYGLKGDKGSSTKYAGLAGLDLTAALPGAGNIAGASKIAMLANTGRKVNKAFHTVPILSKAEHVAHAGAQAATVNKAGDFTYKALSEGPQHTKRQTGGKKVPGGTIEPLPGGAVEFKGRKHKDGGIHLNNKIEVEGGETMDKVNFANGGPGDYIFSEYLKLGGKSFAQRHKEILKNGGKQDQIQALAKLQEEKAKNTKGGDKYGERGGHLIAKNGGKIKAQLGLGPANLSLISGEQMLTDRAMGLVGESQADRYNRTLPNERRSSPLEDRGFEDYIASGGTFNLTPVNPADQIRNSLNIPAPEADTATPESTTTTPAETPTTPADTSTTTTTPSSTSAPAGPNYVDALQGVEGTEVSYSTEDFKRKGQGTSIDFSGDINADSWEDVLQTNWAENYLTDQEGNVRTDLSQEEIQNIYNNEYVPEVQSYFKENPQEAIRAITSFANSGHPNAENLKKRIYNADGTLKSDAEILEVGLQNATDGKIGTFHSVLGMKSEQPEDAPEKLTPKGIPTNPEMEKTLEGTIPDEVKDASGRITPPKLRDVPPLAYATLAGNLVGPLAALATKVPNPRLVSPEMQGRERFGRVNYNAERAANANQTTATTRHIENSGAGPAATIALMAANEQSRQGALDIANQEIRTNTNIANTEKQLNSNIIAQNIQRAYDADIRNKTKLDEYDLLRKQTKVEALSDIGTAGAQFATDVMKYQADEREAMANEIAGEYTRQRYAEKFMKSPKYRNMEINGVKIKDMSPQEIDQLAAAAYSGGEVSLEEYEKQIAAYIKAQEDAKKENKQLGGKKSYFKPLGKINRKTRR